MKNRTRVEVGVNSWLHVRRTERKRWERITLCHRLPTGEQAVHAERVVILGYKQVGSESSRDWMIMSNKSSLWESMLH